MLNAPYHVVITLYYKASPLNSTWADPSHLLVLVFVTVSSVVCSGAM